MIRLCKGAFSGQVLLSSIERAHSFERARLKLPVSAECSYPRRYNLRKRRFAEFASAVHTHLRLRAREDGEEPSPPRDCKAESFLRVSLSG